MNATELQDTLENILDSINDAREEMEGENDDLTLADFARDMADELDGPVSVSTYTRAMMLTTDAGLVLRTADGAEFQITIVQTKRGEDPGDPDEPDDSDE